MKRVLLCLALVACGGKIDPGGDGGSGVDAGGSDAVAKKDAQPTADASPPPPPPPQCTPVSGSTSVGSDGSCKTYASWSCGATSYTVDCSCPSAQCTCSQETGGMGAGTIVAAPGLCPGCSSNLPALCGFPTN